MTNLLIYGDLDEADIALAEDNLHSLQQAFVSRFGELSDEIRAETSTAAREELMTNADMEMASQAHDLALALYRYYTYDEASPLIQGVD